MRFALRLFGVENARKGGRSMSVGIVKILLGGGFGAVSAVCAGIIIVHAFRRSIGTGMMVLFVPCFIFYYAFAHFEHPHKGLIVASFVGGLGLFVVVELQRLLS